MKPRSHTKPLEEDLDEELSRPLLDGWSSVKTDTEGSPSETFNADHYGRVMAEREKRRREGD